MNLVSNNYNSLGKLGPYYERPEYRPPAQNEASPQQHQPRAQGDRSTLSVKNTEAPKKAAAPVVSGKINLDTARQLTAATAQLISQLPPFSTSDEPHSQLSSSLMTPVYA